MPSIRIAVLMTCYNRRDKTVSCLESVKAQRANREVSFEIFLVDDGSEDGTREAVKTVTPHAHVIQGTGHLYWGGGMRLAFAEAMKGDFDFYLLLNDDVVLDENAVETLLSTFEGKRAQDVFEPIISGSLKHPENGRHTYGGLIRTGLFTPLSFILVTPGVTPNRCATFNCNCLLVPRQAAQMLGNLSPEFTHFIGDIDYGLRAEGLGIPCWVAPGYVGTCPDNSIAGTWLDGDLTFGERYRLRESPKGLPLWEWIIFAKRHAGKLWPVYMITSQIRVLVPGVWELLHGRRR